MSDFSYITNASPAYLEAEYLSFKGNPSSVDPEWKKFFEGFDFAISTQNGNGQAISPKEFKVYALINAYRDKAHLMAFTNPIRKRKDRHANVGLEFFGLVEKDLDETFAVGSEVGLGKAKLRDIIQRLETIYARTIGVEYTYIIEPEEKEWFKTEFEKRAGKIELSIDKKKRILHKLNDAVIFEKFLHTKYVGQKRFSLEGGETTIAALDAIINKASELGVDETLIAMAHRGRLNVLANILGKTYAQIFNEFEGNATPDTTMGDGDVKYHMGYSSQITTMGDKNMYLVLSPNPSHLEAVDPVVEGLTRAKADLLYNCDYNRVLPILIHGDASVAGQGIVYEVIQMSQLKGYQTGGTIHFIINNQIGFTTDFDDARSSNYCTSYAATVNAPVLHVNGDDAEAVVMAAELATEYRQKYHKDIFVDMVCYRRHGHNEGDDPKYTQPEMYKLIADHPNPREVYSQRLIERGDIDAELAKSMETVFWKGLQERLDEVKQNPLPYTYQKPQLAWQELRKSTPEDFESSPDTAVSKELLDKVVAGLLKYPDGFTPLRKMQQMIDARNKVYREEGKLDWGMGELAAYGTLLLEGHDVRLSGQDVKRGTFSHRHAVIYDENTNQEYNRPDNIDKDQKGRYRIFNSLLSEFGVLGFEFGYSWASPQSLVIWEAQFGDFANGAQTMIDQFITSGESKWQRMSGITLLLPHGYEGQGAEHSSARLERFLQSSAEFNIQVCNITTPANLFHVFRRQLARPFRKPLVIMSPKSLLRHPRVVSEIKDFTNGGFKELIDDTNIKDATKVKRVVLCSGKLYYDLLDRQEKEARADVALVRLEQLYPLPFKQIEALTAKYKNAAFVWAQEEPANMGAWSYMLSCTYDKMKLTVIARKSSASPATGYSKVHAKEQEAVISSCFAI